jgi:protein-S-isoprenylcysteine O-methyltransferase Ste14
LTDGEKKNWQKIAKRIRVPLGFCFAVVFLVLARPSPASIAWSLLLVLPGVALRGYASGYVKKNAELTTTGPYAWTRNPLYLGSMLIAFGFAAGARSWLLAVLLVLLFAVIYVPVIRGEEQYLRAHFAGFADYAKRVPRLIPWRVPQRGVRGVGDSSHARSDFSPALYRKHREYNASIGTLALYVALLVRLAVEKAAATHGF